MSKQGEEIRRFFERFVEAENRGDMAAPEECLAPDVEVSLNGQLVRNTAAAQMEATRANLAAFPDRRREILAIAVDGNIGVLRWTGAGTHRGPFGGIPASGNRVTISGTSWPRLSVGWRGGSGSTWTWRGHCGR
jgi:predicted ester cyclase